VQDGSAGLPFNNTIYIMVERTLSAGHLVGLRLYARSKSPIRIQIWKPSGSPTLSSQVFTLQDEVVFTPPSPGYYRVSEISKRRNEHSRNVEPTQILERIFSPKKLYFEKIPFFDYYILNASISLWFSNSGSTISSLDGSSLSYPLLNESLMVASPIALN
jgi:hypothetical protein